MRATAYESLVVAAELRLDRRSDARPRAPDSYQAWAGASRCYRLMFSLRQRSDGLRRRCDAELRGWHPLYQAVKQRRGPRWHLQGEPNTLAHLLWCGMHGIVSLDLAAAHQRSHGRRSGRADDGRDGPRWSRSERRTGGVVASLGRSGVRAGPTTAEAAGREGSTRTNLHACQRCLASVTPWPTALPPPLRRARRSACSWPDLDLPPRLPLAMRCGPVAAVCGSAHSSRAARIAGVEATQRCRSCCGRACGVAHQQVAANRPIAECRPRAEAVRRRGGQATARRTGEPAM